MSTGKENKAAGGAKPDPKQAAAAANPKQQAKDAKADAKQQAKAAKAKAAEAAAEEDAEADEELAESNPHWFGRSVRWASTSWGISLLINMCVVIAMGLYAFPPNIVTQVRELVATAPEERPEELIQEVLEQDVTPSKDLALTSNAVSAVQGAAGSVSALAEPQMNTQVSEAPSEVQVAVGEINVFASSGNHLSSELPEGTLGEAMASAGSYSDAMDRMTKEILAKLAKDKVLLVWSFDQSNSMVDDRQEIMARIGRVYEELGIAKSAQGDALVTAITSYGAKMLVHTPQPTSNVEEILAGIAAVPVDESGQEQMCPAIGFTIANFRNFAQKSRRQMMLILVTDESGEADSNSQYLESTIAEAKAARCPIYCLGRESVFGYPYAHMQWEDPQTGIDDFWIRIDRGPETPFPEVIQTNGYHRRMDAHASGFGPYDETRLARETGGIFFMLPSPEVRLHRRDERKYSAESMRPYLPDLSSRADYAADRDKSDMRRTIWKVINDFNPYAPSLEKVVQLRWWDFSIDKATFATQAKEEVAKAQRLIQMYRDAQLSLEKVKPLRERESSLRWRANFDLAYAQTVAFQVRLEEYIAYLNLFVQQPKPIKNVFGAKRPTNEWHAHTVARTLTDQKTAKLRAQATELLTKVMTEHVGTPWGTYAEDELKRGFGLDMHEDYDDPRRAGIKVPKY